MTARRALVAALLTLTSASERQTLADANAAVELLVDDAEEVVLALPSARSPCRRARIELCAILDGPAAVDGHPFTRRASPRRGERQRE